jgi:hypothetical protein
MNRAELRKITKEVAKQNNVTAAEVTKEIKAAISATYENPTPAALAVTRKNDVPSAQEFIEHIAQKAHLSGWEN